MNRITSIYSLYYNCVQNNLTKIQAYSMLPCLESLKRPTLPDLPAIALCYSLHVDFHCPLFSSASVLPISVLEYECALIRIVQLNFFFFSFSFDWKLFIICQKKGLMRLLLVSSFISMNLGIVVLYYLISKS